MRVNEGRCGRCGKQGTSHIRGKAAEALSIKLRLSGPTALINTGGGQLLCRGCFQDGAEDEST